MFPSGKIEEPVGAVRTDGSQFRYELAILIAIFAVTTAVFHFVVYPMLGWSSHSPMPLRSIALAGAIVLLTWSVKGNLSSLGLAMPRSVWLTLLLIILFLAVKMFALQPATGWFKTALSIPPSDTSFFSHIHGNLAAYLGWLSIAWVAGGFAEEIIFRGYLINKISAIFNDTFLASIIAIVAQATLFGLAHFYQGWGGMLSIALGAIFSGTFYVLIKRNLWVLIFAHAIWDTLGITLIFFNGAPTTS